MLIYISFSRFGHHVSSIETNGDKWNVKTQQGEDDNFDAVVLTMPVPQLFGLTGSVKELLGILSVAFAWYFDPSLGLQVVSSSS